MVRLPRLQHVHQMRQEGQQRLRAFACARRAAGQVDQHRRPAHPRHAAREGRERTALEALGQQILA